MLDPRTSLVLVMDMQDKLLAVMENSKALLEKTITLVEIANLLDIPIVITEQYPKGLGPTQADLLRACREKPISKTSFSALGESQVTSKLKEHSAKDIVLCGIEAHVCIYQSAKDLLQQGLRVHMVSDAVSSRSKENKSLALTRLSQQGVHLSSLEMIAFEWLRDASHPHFKEIAKRIK